MFFESRFPAVGPNGLATHKISYYKRSVARWPLGRCLVSIVRPLVFLFLYLLGGRLETKHHLSLPQTVEKKKRSVGNQAEVKGMFLGSFGVRPTGGCWKVAH